MFAFKVVLWAFLLQLSMLASEIDGVLKRVIDGDTLYFRVGGSELKCRIANIDTPESRKNNKAAKDISGCFATIDEMVALGQKATAFAKEKLIIGETYGITKRGIDHHGRATCRIRTPSGNLDELLIKEGYAVPFWGYIDNPIDKAHYAVLLLQAILEQKGLWSISPMTMACLAIK